jgi:outer membrane cobalamin receptor
LWLAAGVSSAFAQDETPVVERIVVTAQKREQDLQKVPISVKALQGEELDRVNADSLDDITRMVPSLTMTNLSRGGNQVQIRGLGSNVGSVGTVAIYNDGVIASSRIQSSGTFAEQDSALYDVDRIEVLRGPQGTLYGEGSFGGVINIISREPNSRAIEASFSGTWFDVKEGSSENFDLQGMVNVPIVEDLLAVRGWWRTTTTTMAISTRSTSDRRYSNCSRLASEGRRSWWRRMRTPRTSPGDALSLD